jgi:F-type H+-transporting ATPase subunit b
MAYLQGGGQETEAPVLLAQVEENGTETEHEEAAGEHGAAGEEEHGVLAEVFHWINFILIVGGVWYLLKKIVGPLFAERTRAIQEHMMASERAMKEASKRLAGIEQKLQYLDEEIRDIRLTAQREAAAEQTRMEEVAQAEASKIAQAAEQEIETAAKAARRELQKYSAELAIGLAEKRIRETISSDAEKRILRSFVSDLGDGSGRS